MDVSQTNPHHERRWLILAIIGLAQLMVVLDATIVNIALPSAQRDLGLLDRPASGSSPPTRWPSAGCCCSAAASATCSAASGPSSAACSASPWPRPSAAPRRPSACSSRRPRRSRACSARMLAPSALALLTTTFPDPSRARQGVRRLRRHRRRRRRGRPAARRRAHRVLSWRWCLYVNLLFAIPAALAALRLLRQPGRGAPPAPGPARARLPAPAGCSRSCTASPTPRRTRWGDAGDDRRARRRGRAAGRRSWSIEARVAAPAAAAARRHRPRRAAAPTSPIGDRRRSRMFGVFLFLTYYLQQTQGYSPIQTGLAFLPMTAAIIVTARRR